MSSDDQLPGGEHVQGLLPPDGVAWPPEPPAAPTPVVVGDLGAGPASRPADAHIDDWRSMPVDAPAGYRGSRSAPLGEPNTDVWSVLSFATAVVGLLPFLWSAPVLSVLAIAFGITGRRTCSLDPMKRGGRWATAGLVIGVLTLVTVGAMLAAGRLTLGV